MVASTFCIGPFSICLKPLTVTTVDPARSAGNGTVVDTNQSGRRTKALTKIWSISGSAWAGAMDTAAPAANRSAAIAAPGGPANGRVRYQYSVFAPGLTSCAPVGPSNTVRSELTNCHNMIEVRRVGDAICVPVVRLFALTSIN